MASLCWVPRLAPNRCPFKIVLCRPQWHRLSSKATSSKVKLLVDCMKSRSGVHPSGDKYDVAVIGGGSVGSSVAYHLKMIDPKLSVVVIERDPTYAKASTTLSAGGIRQQFSIPENILMSQYGYEFIQHFERNVAVGDHPAPDINFFPGGYCLAASEAGVDILRKNYEVQKEYGAKVALLGPKALKERYSWVNTDGIALAGVGLEAEGWFDPWALLNGLKAKATSMGAEYVQGEVTKMEVEPSVSSNRIKEIVVKVKPASGEVEERTFQAAFFALCAGAHSATLAFSTEMSKANGLKLPIEPRKRYIFYIHAPNGPGMSCPLFVDPSGVYFRREGIGGYLAGMSPEEEDEPKDMDLNAIDFSLFEETMWPLLARRVPAFEQLKVKNAWAGYYDYNVVDQNAIIGPHPLHPNLILASGFSGHGLQHAPAAGRAVAELVYHGEYKKIYLSRFSYDRVIQNAPLRELNVI